MTNTELARVLQNCGLSFIEHPGFPSGDWDKYCRDIAERFLERCDVALKLTDSRIKNPEDIVMGVNGDPAEWKPKKWADNVAEDSVSLKELYEHMAALHSQIMEYHSMK